MAPCLRAVSKFPPSPQLASGRVSHESQLSQLHAPPPGRHRAGSRSSNTEVLPGTGITQRTRSGAAFTPNRSRDLSTQESAPCLAERDRLQVPNWTPGTETHPGPIAGHAGLPGIPGHSIGYLVPAPGLRCSASNGQCRCRTGAAGRPATRRAHPQRPLCAERRECPLGLALRRPLRHGCDPRKRMAPSVPAPTTRCAAPRSSPIARQCARSGRSTAGGASHADARPRATRSTAGQLLVRLKTRRFHHRAASTPAAFALATRAMPRVAHERCCFLNHGLHLDLQH